MKRAPQALRALLLLLAPLLSGCGLAATIAVVSGQSSSSRSAAFGPPAPTVSEVSPTAASHQGGMEIEIRGSATQPEELIDRVYGFAHYQASHGPVLEDGDTIGASADERITIRHVPSAWDRPGPVLQLDL